MDDDLFKKDLEMSHGYDLWRSKQRVQEIKIDGKLKKHLLGLMEPS